MNMLNDYLIIKNKNNIPNETQVITSEAIRITVLFDEVIRVERGNSSTFTDSATQIVFNRKFDVKYEYEITSEYIIIKTWNNEFHIHKKNKNKDYVITNSKKIKISNKYNLGGTARTLDMTNGYVRVFDGILSRNGVSFFIDNTCLLCDDGTFKKRNKEIDEYIFSYTNRYIDALNAYYKLTGYPPLLRRYVFGNWWSRYYKYTQDEYLSLMKKFKNEGYPFGISMIDMDWHYTDVKKRFNYKRWDKHTNILNGYGWTGYTWNKELFYDYKSFLNELHNMNLHPSLNLHPAQGIRPFEEKYSLMAKANNVIDDKSIEFDFTNNDYINSYFDIIHRPFENDGIDFYWIDWQQGTHSNIKGLDPLFLLNHYHTLESSINSRPLILSRYSGLGAHRYPIGFSGDTIMSFKSLKLEASFTPQASNVGYTYWSHDIGGHMFGHKDPKLYIRWLEFGVFSPINRLHSSNTLKYGKEPWNYDNNIQKIAKFYLNLRYRLIPYIYSMSIKTHLKGIPLIMPLYYKYPIDDNAYKYKSEYFFGDEMIISPITSRDNKTKVYLPDGKWINYFSGDVYIGPKEINIEKPLDKIPIFLKEGSIIPLSNEITTDIPNSLEVLIYKGNNSYTLYEDDGLSTNDTILKTKFRIEESFNRYTFNIFKGVGNTHLYEKREYILSFKDICLKNYKVFINDEEINIQNDNNCIKLTLSPNDKLEIIIDR